MLSRLFFSFFYLANEKHNSFRWLKCQFVWFWALKSANPIIYTSKIHAKLKEFRVNEDGLEKVGIRI